MLLFFKFTFVSAWTYAYRGYIYFFIFFVFFTMIPSKIFQTFRLFVVKPVSLLLFAAFYMTVDHIKVMICVRCTQACHYCQRSDISVKHLTCTVKYF